jgi:uncharacterized protein YutE (UPF0331/DUF86 family)
MLLIFKGDTCRRLLMPLFDQEIMVRLVTELRKSAARLRDISKLSEAGFLKDPDKIGSAKYHFIVAIECCIDMCNHIIARNGFRAPEDYGDTFRVMSEEGALREEFSDELVNMAKFRNRLVHLYWEVKDKQVYEILQTRLDDFKKLLDALSNFLNFKDIK